MKKSTLVYSILTIIILFGYFLLIGSYPLLDVDETRYVEIARTMIKNHDFMTLYLNGEYFFEKPPLYFWLECLAFKTFGGINELTARLPIILLSLLPLGLLFGLCKKVKNIRFALITACVLLTSLEYVLITKIAILDSVLTSFVTSAVLCYFYTFFVREKNKKYFWLLSYFFSGLTVLAKGIPGFVIPFGTILISTIVFKTYKDTLKHSVIGMVLFLTITLPWHILMLKTYPDLFFSEYIYKHHILRFLGSEIIHRNEPWYFYILTLLWGLMPHTFVLIGKLLNGIKLTKPNLENKYSKFLILNSIAFLVTLIFFSLSGAKLITYILPAYPFLAVIIAHIWSGYITKDNLKIKYALIGINSILILASLAVPFAASFTLGENAGNLHYMQVILAILAYFLIINMIKNKRFRIFICQAIFTAALFGFTAPLGYKLDYSFGQDDLIAYAKLAKEHNYTISAYKTGKKYSLLYYSELPQIEFQNEDNIEWLNNELNKKENLVIIKNKDIPKLPENTAFKLAEKGVKYSIIEKLF